MSRVRIPERAFAFFAFNLAIMKNEDSCGHSESVESNLCYIVAEFTLIVMMQCGSLFWLNIYRPFTFRNIAPWLAVIFKKTWMFDVCYLSRIQSALVPHKENIFETHSSWRRLKMKKNCRMWRLLFEREWSEWVSEREREEREREREWQREWGASLKFLTYITSWT